MVGRSGGAGVAVQDFLESLEVAAVGAPYGGFVFGLENGELVSGALFSQFELALEADSVCSLMILVSEFRHRDELAGFSIVFEDEYHDVALLIDCRTPSSIDIRKSLCAFNCALASSVLALCSISACSRSEYAFENH